MTGRAPFATSPGASLAAAAKASASAPVAASIIAHNKDQKGGAVSGHASRRLSHLCFQIGGFSSSPRRRSALINLPLSVDQTLPVRAIRGCARFFIDAIRLPASRVQSLSDQQLSKSFADLDHFSKRLSLSFVCCINKCSQARTNSCHSVTRGDG